MKNIIKIDTDKINVYATIQVKSSTTGIRVLSFLITLALILFVTVLTQIKANEVLSMIIPIFLVLIFMIGMPTKYLLWNKYGQEFLIVNTKSVSWSYDYGIIKTNLNTSSFDRLGIEYEKVMTIGEEETGRLIFFNYRKEDNLPEIMHQTIALLSKSVLGELIDKISGIFSSELEIEGGFIPFSKN